MAADGLFVSVIIPVFNGESFLRDAVASIQHQDCKTLEIIIVDDGSTDTSAEIAKGMGDNVQYVYQPNSGPSVARNKGISMAQGNVIGFLDVDDIWSKNKLKLQCDLLAQHPLTEIVVGYTQRLQRTADNNGTYVFERWDDPLLTMHIGSAIFRRSAFDKVGLFDESLGFCEDWDWFMRAKELNVSILVHKETTYDYRRHEHNMTNDTELNFKYALRMLKQSLDRRRKQHNGEATHLPQLSDFTLESLLSSSKKDGAGD